MLHIENKVIPASALLALLAGFAIAAAAQSITAYEGARLITGDGGVIENATLVVHGATIAQAGAAAQVKVPAGATRVNLADKTVMPAIIETHTHLSNQPDALLRDLRQRAYYGIGAALSLGLDTDNVLPLRAEVRPGSARFLSAGRGITAPEPGRPTPAHWITSAAEGRKAVAELAAQKVTIVKIWVDDRYGKFTKLSPELYSAIIDEAHKSNLRVTVHEYYLEDAKALLRAGVDWFAHSIRDRDIDDEMVALFKQHPNVGLTPTMNDQGKIADLQWLKVSLPAGEFAKLEAANINSPEAQAIFGIQARNLARLVAAGVRITLGTDLNRAWAPHFEMEDMVAAGMTPMQVIVAATRNGAEFLRLNDMGTLAAGKSADFIVLDANPLDDITNTRRISSVVLRGVTVDRSHAP